MMFSSLIFIGTETILTLFLILVAPEVKMMEDMVKKC